MLSRNLEQTLHRSLSLASERRHEYATLEHLLLGLGRRFRRRHGAARLRGRSRQAAERSGRVPRQGPGRPGHRPPGRPEAHRRLPARRAARRDPRAVLRPRRGDRGERAGGAVLRARKPRGVFPATAGHDPAGRSEFHQPRHRQGARALHPAPGHRHNGPSGEPSGAGAGGKAEPPQPGRAVELLREPEQEGDGREDRPADRPRVGDRADHPDPLPPHQEQPALRRRSRRRQDRDRRGAGQAHRRGRRARSAGHAPPSSPWTWARCSPAPAIAAISRSG